MSHTIQITDKDRLQKVRSILVSQPQPRDQNSPYLKLAEKYNIKVDFVPFIKIEPVTLQEFRNQKINIAKHSAVIFTSRNAVDHFFRLARATRAEIKPDTKYFCISEQTAHYLQKYIVIRKRKIFAGRRTASELIELLKKHKKEKYLFPCSDLRREDIPAFLSSQGIYHHELIIYYTRASDLFLI